MPSMVAAIKCRFPLVFTKALLGEGFIGGVNIASHVKRSLTALDYAALLRESLNEVEGLRLQKAWMLGDAVVARFREPLVGDYTLVLSPSIGVYVTRYQLPKEEHQRSLFLKELRQLKGARLECIRQVNLDRVAALTFKRGERVVEVVVEWVREGNLLVVEGGRINAVLKQRKLRDRCLAVGEVYAPPPQRGFDPLTLTFHDIMGHVTEKLSAASLLSKLVNAPGELVAESLYRAGVDPLALYGSLDSTSLRKAVQELKNLYVQVLSGKLEPCVAFSNGEAVAAYPLHLIHLRVELKPFDSFTEAVDEAYTKLLVRKPETGVGAAIEASKLAEMYRARAAELRRAAEQLMTRSGSFEELLREFKRLRSSIDWEKIYFELKAKYPELVSVEPEDARLKVNVDGVEVELDASVSIARNASKLFELAKDLERKARKASEVAANLKPQLTKQTPLRLQKPRKWYQNFRYFISSEGFLVIGGKDASQNEAIVKKYMDAHDLFIHADVHGGPVVVVKTEGREVGEATLMEAAQVAAAYSRAWEHGLTAVDVYFVRADQVSKKPPSGEYLGKGSFMVYGKRNYLKNVKLELAIGAKVSDETVEILAGPPPAMAGYCQAMVTLEPGRTAREEVAKKIARLLSDGLESKGYKIKVSPQEVLQLLPRGGFYLKSTTPLNI